MASLTLLTLIPRALQFFKDAVSTQVYKDQLEKCEKRYEKAMSSKRVKKLKKSEGHKD